MLCHNNSTLMFRYEEGLQQMQDDENDRWDDDGSDDNTGAELTQTDEVGLPFLSLS